MSEDQLIYDKFGRIEPEDPRFKQIYPQQRLEARVLYDRFTSVKSQSQHVQILADDVGLGKTRIAMIVLFAMLKRSGRDHSLIVAPTRMVASNWMNELRRYSKNCLPPETAKRISIELVTSGKNLKNRIVDIHSAATRKQKIERLFAQDLDIAPLGFLAFCLREYLEATGLLRNQKRTALVNRMMRWIHRIELRRHDENSPFDIDSFYRFFSQEEILRFMRFLRRFAAEVRYNSWMTVHADQETILAALQRKRMGRLSKFLRSLAIELDISEDDKARKWAFNSNRQIIGKSFLRLAAEVMPQLEALTKEKTEQKKQHSVASNITELQNLENALSFVLDQDQKERRLNVGDGGTTKAMRCMAWLFRMGLPPNERHVDLSQKARLAKDFMERLSAEITNVENEEFQKLFDLSEVRWLMRRIRRYLLELTSHGFPSSELLSIIHSPWSMPGWVHRNAAKLEVFFEGVADALQLHRTPKRYFPNSHNRSEMAVLFVELCRELCRFERTWAGSSDSSFWDRQKLAHHIFVIYANDLKDSEDLEIQEQLFPIVVIDEAHNWRNGKKGAQEFRQYWSSVASHILLLTATPLQLAADDLKRMLDVVMPFDEVDKGPFPKLFGRSGSFAEGMLERATELRDKVEKAWDDLGARDRVRMAHEVEILGDEKDRSLKLLRWKALSNENEETPSVQRLANAVLDYSSYLEEQIRFPLFEIMMKHRARNNRVFYCGSDVTKVLAGEVVPLRRRFYLTEGIPNYAALFNFICMRISSFAREQEDRNRPRLMLGLPSSYEAFLESAIGSRLHEQAGSYSKLLEEIRLHAKLKIPHPKLTVTVEVILKNLLERGEKTLVFCERVKTVETIAETLQCRIDDFFNSHGWMDEKILNRYSMLCTSMQGESSMEKIFIRVLSELSQEIFVSLFPKAQWGYKGRNQENFDARVLLVITQVVRKLSKQKNDIQLHNVLEMAESLIYPADEESIDWDKEDRESLGAFEVLTGNQQNRREAILEGFSSVGLPLVLICSPVSQEGVNLHRFCRQIVLHDLNWNPALLEQRIGRVDRRGSFAVVRNHPVEVYVPFLSASYDEYQYRVILERSELQELAFGHNEFVVDEISEDDYSYQEDFSLPKNSQTKRVLLGELIHGLFDIELSVTEANAKALEG